MLWMLFSVGQALVYHLSDVKGMSLWPDKFAAVGLSQTAARDAVRVAGSFMLKARELQQSVFSFATAFSVCSFLYANLWPKLAYFLFRQCFDTIGWATGRTSGLQQILH